jgi:uncharacterized protein (TIGR03083 family)
MTQRPRGDDIARHYLTAHERIVRLATALTPEQAATPVQATPGWDVHDVLAHLAGLATDAVTGRLQGMPTDEVTGGQVAERRDRTVEELVAEWTTTAPQLAEGARAGLAPPNLAVDALTHEQDMRGALGMPPALDPEELRFCTDLYAFGMGYALKKAEVAPLRIEATDTDFAFTAGIGDPAATVRAPEFELFRALAGRRGRRQVEQFGWDGDLSPYLDRFSVFGAVPADDLTG